MVKMLFCLNLKTEIAWIQQFEFATHYFAAAEIVVVKAKRKITENV
jgi:hypothetical protein